MLLPNFYHPFFLYCVKTPTNDDGNFGELEFLCTFVAKSKPLSKTRQSIANRTVSKSLPEHQPIVRNTLLQRVVAFLSKVTEKLLFSEKNKKTIRSVIKNAGKHNEGKSYSVQVLVGISAVFLSIAISPLFFSVF